MEQLVGKWAKKLENCTSDNEIKNLACLLENEHLFLAGMNSTTEREDGLKSIKVLEKQLDGDFPQAVKDVLQEEIDKQYKALPRQLSDSFLWKHVNIIDEALKTYDQLTAKDIV